MAKEKVNTDFKKLYDRTFKKDPILANTYLIINEIWEDEDDLMWPAMKIDMFERFAGWMLSNLPDPRRYAL
jgi:hypothetical protein